MSIDNVTLFRRILDGYIERKGYAHSKIFDENRVYLLEIELKDMKSEDRKSLIISSCKKINRLLSQSDYCSESEIEAHIDAINFTTIGLTHNEVLECNADIRKELELFEEKIKKFAEDFEIDLPVPIPPATKIELKCKAILNTDLKDKGLIFEIRTGIEEDFIALIRNEVPSKRPLRCKFWDKKDVYYLLKKLSEEFGTNLSLLESQKVIYLQDGTRFSVDNCNSAYSKMLNKGTKRHEHPLIDGFLKGIDQRIYR